MKNNPLANKTNTSNTNREPKLEYPQFYNSMNIKLRGLYLHRSRISLISTYMGHHEPPSSGSGITGATHPPAVGSFPVGHWA